MKNLGRYKRMNVGSVAQFGSGLCRGTFFAARSFELVARVAITKLV